MAKQLPDVFVKAYINRLCPMGLCGNPLGLYLVLLKHAQNKGCCWPSEETLMEALGASKATLRRYLGTLEALGLVQRPPQGVKVSKKHPYQIRTLQSILSEESDETSIKIERSEPIGPRSRLNRSSRKIEVQHHSNLDASLYEVDKGKEIKEVESSSPSPPSPAAASVPRSEPSGERGAAKQGLTQTSLPAPAARPGTTPTPTPTLALPHCPIDVKAEREAYLEELKRVALLGPESAEWQEQARRGKDSLLHFTRKQLQQEGQLL
jgi:predicted transcriptional regulator